MRILFLTFVTTFFFSASFANGESLTIERFLATAEKDTQLQSHSELVEYMEASPESTPYIDKIEFRTETDEFDIKKQKYSLRFYPRGWGETELSKKISETTGKSVRAEHESLFGSVLQNRYELALDFLETLSMLNMNKTLLSVYDDEVNVLRKMSVRDLSFDIRTLVSAEDRYVDLQLELVKLENKVTGIIEKIKSIAGYYEEIMFDEETLIGPETIGERIRDIQPVPSPDNIRLRYQLVKAELAENRYMFEVAKNKKYLNFFNLQYDSDKDDSAEKAFSIEVGINLPFVNPDREDINRRKRVWFDEKLEYEKEQREASETIRSLSASLDRLDSSAPYPCEPEAGKQSRNFLQKIYGNGRRQSADAPENKGKYSGKRYAAEPDGLSHPASVYRTDEHHGQIVGKELVRGQRFEVRGQRRPAPQTPHPEPRRIR